MERDSEDGSRDEAGREQARKCLAGLEGREVIKGRESEQ